MVLTKYWDIDIGFSEKDPEFIEALDMATSSSFPITTASEFDSPEKPLTNKRGIDKEKRSRIWDINKPAKLQFVHGKFLWKDFLQEAGHFIMVTQEIVYVTVADLLKPLSII